MQYYLSLNNLPCIVILMVSSTGGKSIYILPQTYTILMALRNARYDRTIDDILMKLLNESVNSDTQLFLKTCHRGGVDVQIPGTSSFWSDPLFRGKKPKRIDLRMATLRYVCERGED